MLWLIACSSLLAIQVGRARAPVTFVVNSPTDVVGINPGNHDCETAPGNHTCTLRRAIIEANAWIGGGATIDLTSLPGTARLTIPASGNDDATSGDLNITASMTIVGGGRLSTIIDGNGSFINDGVFNVQSGVVTISGVQITNGTAHQRGGGISNAGNLTLVNSWVVSNASPVDGGGVSNETVGLLTVVDSIISNNTAQFGGGIYNRGTLSFAGSTIRNNTASGFGGGLATDGSGGCCFYGSSTITRSTVSSNQSQGDGGGIYSYHGAIVLTNSTVTGNFANHDGAGIFTNEAATILNSTITNNQADTDKNGSGIGGGIFKGGAFDEGNVTFQNTILAANTETAKICVSSCFFVLVTGDCAGPIVSNGFNLMLNYDTSHCTVTGNVVLADPKLGPLQPNGGPTFTHALLPGSPAINAGDTSGCRDSLGAPLATDQRGYPRPVFGSGARCDIGAFEVGSPNPHDLDDNGEADVLWRNPSTGEDGLWLMNGFSIQAAQAIAGAGAPWQIAGVGDFDGDGHADILWRNPVTGENGIWLMQGFTVLSAQAIPGVAPNWRVAGTGDFDGDGQDDILWRDANSGQAGVWLMHGLTPYLTQVISGPIPDWDIAGVGDFNGDGYADILWRQSTTGQAGIWLMQGFIPATTQLISGPNPNWQIASVGDFNGDGRADILWRNPTTGENSVWLMNGVTMQSGQAIPGAGIAWQVAGAYDFNGDGRADILWRNLSTGDNGLWLMNGSAIQAAQSIPGVSSAWEIH